MAATTDVLPGVSDDFASGGGGGGDDDDPQRIAKMIAKMATRGKSHTFDPSWVDDTEKPKFCKRETMKLLREIMQPGDDVLSDEDLQHGIMQSLSLRLLRQARAGAAVPNAWGRPAAKAMPRARSRSASRTSPDAAAGPKPPPDLPPPSIFNGAAAGATIDLTSTHRRANPRMRHTGRWLFFQFVCEGIALT